MPKINTNCNIYDYAGRIIRVELSNKKITKEYISESMLWKFIGGEGLAAKILFDEVPPEVKPFDSENRVIVSNGLLSGSLAPSACRMTLTTISPNTEIYSDSNGGGHFAPELKFAGYDHIIFQGRAEDPVYLWIDDDTVELRDARHLWGKTTWETDTMIKKELHDPSIHVACIGPAGENLSGAACFIIDRARACGRMGLGAVIGYKKLKAIAVRGRKGYKIANPKEHIRICKELFDKVINDPFYDTLNIGTVAVTNVGWSGKDGHEYPMVRYGMTEKHYMPDWENICVKNIQEKIWEHDTACFGCPLHCGNWINVKAEDNPYGMDLKGEGFELNIHEDSTYMDCAQNIYFLPRWHLRCNELGLGVDEATLPTAFAMCLWDKGIINEKDTGGIKLEWGNEEAVLELIEQIAYRQGFGDLLADGTKKAAQKIGRGSEYYSKNVKGAEFIADLRLGYSTALAESVTPRGACHLKGLTWLNIWGAIPDYVSLTERKKYVEQVCGFPGEYQPMEPSCLPWVVKYNIIHMAILDVLEMCTFPTHWDLYYSYHWKDLAPLIESATGITFNEDELRELGERVRAVQRSFNHLRGLISREDDTPPQLVFEYPMKATYKGKDLELKLDRGKYDELLNQFYKLFGYDKETGIPTRETFKQLGIEDVANELEKRGILPK